MSSQCNAPVFEPKFGFQCFFLKIQYLIYSTLPFPLKFLSSSFECSLQKLKFKVEHCTTGNQDATIDLQYYSNSKLKQFLDNNSEIADSIHWSKLDNRNYWYRNWTASEKHELYVYYDKISNNQDLNLSETPEHTISTKIVTRGNIDREEVIGTNFTPEVAWNYFLGFLAMTLINEFEKRVAWSFIINNNPFLNTEIRKNLLFSSSLFEFKPNENLYQIGNQTPNAGLRKHVGVKKKKEEKIAFCIIK